MGHHPLFGCLENNEDFGAPDRSRTYDPQYRKLMLYPAELRVHSFGEVCLELKMTNYALYDDSMRYGSQF